MVPTAVSKRVDFPSACWASPLQFLSCPSLFRHTLLRSVSIYFDMFGLQRGNIFNCCCSIQPFNYKAVILTQQINFETRWHSSLCVNYALFYLHFIFCLIILVSQALEVQWSISFPEGCFFKVKYQHFQAASQVQSKKTHRTSSQINLLKQISFFKLKKIGFI